MGNHPIPYLFQTCSALDTIDFQHAVGAAADKFGTATASVGSKIFSLLKLNICVDALLTHVIVSPQVPAVVSIEKILDKFIGDEAFTNDMKQYTGWRVRQIIEFLGGEWVRAGERIRGSEYKSGSVYQIDEALLTTTF